MISSSAATTIKQPSMIIRSTTFTISSRCLKSTFLLLFSAFFLCTSYHYFIKPASALSYEITTPSVTTASSSAASAQHQAGPPVVDVIIVGSGPVGLASALTLSQPPHNCQVCVVESNPMVNYYDPTKAFLYNINNRGLKFVTQFPSLYEKLQRSAVRSEGMLSNFMIVPADPSSPLPKTDDDDDEAFSLSSGLTPFDINKVSFWIPRHEFTRVIKEVAEEENLNLQLKKFNNTQNSTKNNNVGSISLLFGMECMDVLPSASMAGDEKSYGVEVILKNLTTNQLSTVRCNLAVGADGYKSLVRDCLRNNNNNNNNKFHLSNQWPNIPLAKFQVKRYTSPATGLRIKVLQLPPQFEIGNVSSTYVTKGHYIYSIRGRNTKSTEYINLGLLPMKDNNAVRPANTITRPNHILWKLQSGKEVKEWFQNSFPRLNFTSMVPQVEWDRFAKAEGSRFPHCQYSNGVALSSLDKQSGVVLVGDAIHSFPPDIGQGINAGLADVMALGKALENVNFPSSRKAAINASRSDHVLLGDALKKFDRDRMKETKALISLARFGSPYQYRQPLFIDKIGRNLWMANIIVRTVLNKISFGLLPPAAIQLCNQKPDLSYYQVMLRANLLTFGLGAFGSLLIKKMCLTLWHLIAKS